MFRFDPSGAERRESAPAPVLAGLLALAALLLTLSGVPAVAQRAPDPAAPAGGQVESQSGRTDQALAALRAVLADEAARARLIAELDRSLAERSRDGSAPSEHAAPVDANAAAAPPPAPAPVPTAAAEENGRPKEAPLVQSVAAQITRFLAAETDLLMRRAGELVETFAALPAVLGWVLRQFADSSARAFWGEIAGGLLLALGAGVLAGWLATKPTRRIRHHLATRPQVTLGDRAFASAGDALTRLLALLAFVMVTLLVLSLLEPRWFVRGITYAVIYAMAGYGLVMLAFRVFLRPKTPAFRILRLSDPVAMDLWRRLNRIVACGALIYFITRTAVYWRLPPSVEGFVLAAIGLITAVLVMRLVLHYRHPVATAIAPASAEDRGGVAALRRWTAGVWHYPVLVYIALVYLVWVLGVEKGFTYLALSSLWSLVVLAIAGGLLIGVRRLVREPEEDATEDEDDEVPTAGAGAERTGMITPPSWAPVRDLANGLILVLTVLGLLEAWGLGGLSWMVGELGWQLGSTLLTLALMVGGAVVALRLVGSLLKRSLAASERRGVPPEQLQRLKTIAPLLRNALFVVIVTIVLLVGLSELGVDITPLLAGAGVIGLAIGFGAQTLVKDVITGLFILIEDTVAVGDVAEIGGKSGVVEAMTIRALRLRDLSGNVHTLPFSMVTSVTNYTKEYSYALLDVTVAYREDVAGVMAVMEEVADRLIQDPAHGGNILGTLEMFGLDRFEDNGMVIRARIQTRPGLQWQTRRAYHALLKQRFDELGIEIPYPQQTLHMAEPRAGAAPALRVTLDQGRGWAIPGTSPPSGPTPPAGNGDPGSGEDDGADGTGGEAAPAKTDGGSSAGSGGGGRSRSGPSRSRKSAPKASRAGSSG